MCQFEHGKGIWWMAPGNKVSGNLNHGMDGRLVIGRLLVGYLFNRF